MTETSIKIQEAFKILKLKDLPQEKDFQKILKKKYYELAFEVHPDKSGSKEAFQNLSDAYHFLTGIFKNHKPELKEFLNVENIKKKDNDLISEKTKGFKLYKKAMKEYSEALEDYFHKARMVNLNPDDPDYLLLCEKFRNIKKDLFSLVQSNPSEIWVADCIEKIHRINVWLKNQNLTVR